MLSLLRSYRLHSTKTRFITRGIVSSAPRTGLCPSCSRRLPTALPVCPNCWHISPIPSQTTYHDIFSLPDQPNPFSVDLATLKQRFRQAQAVVHPDAWVSQAPAKQDLASNLSAQVNTAYQTLLRSLPRVEYILARNGHPLQETDQVMDMEFISEVIETREQLENSESKEEVAEIAASNSESMEAMTVEIERLVGLGKWEEAKEAAAKLRYYDKIAKAVDKWLEQRGL